MNAGIESTEMQAAACFSTWFGTAVPEPAELHHRPAQGSQGKAESAKPQAPVCAFEFEGPMNFFGYGACGQRV
jgi:hypothetical protein